VRASFSVAWKNPRPTAPHRAGESLVKPVAVKIARIMSSDAIAQECATKQHCRAKCTYNQIDPRAAIACAKFCG